MKKAFLFLTILLVGMYCFAGQFQSIPVDHEVYRVIDWAVEAGILPVQTDVKPYNLDKIQSLLDVIYSDSSLKASERAKIDNIRKDFENNYGVVDSHEVADLFRTGYFGKTGKYTDVRVGGSLETTQTFGLSSTNSRLSLDSRNRISAYVRGDIFNAFSYDLNFKVMVDKLAPTAFLQTDFKIDCDGFYVAFDEYLKKVDEVNSFKIGYSSSPEISTTLFNGMVSLRYASIERDWGAGVNNIVLSPTAGTMNAFDFTLQPFPFMTYSVVHGSLGKIALGGPLEEKKSTGTGTVLGILYPTDGMHEDYYDNNYVAHKAELTVFDTVKLSVWEGMVYRTRFELAYVNPFAIYMFEQNRCGDFDNVLAGFDGSIRIRNFGTLYASFGMDELASLSGFLSNPRNIIALQGGLKFKVPDGGFGEVTLQATYIPPFYGSHYGYNIDGNTNPWGRDGYMTTYVNAGRNIAYPVNPDTIELLANYETSLNDSLDISVLAKLQLRSAQYASHSTGTDILDTIDYGAFDSGAYAPKAFFSNMWRQTLDLEFGLDKKFKDLPIELTSNFQMIVDRSREFYGTTTDPYDYGTRSYGYVDWATDAWTNKVNFNCSIGCKIYY